MFKQNVDETQTGFSNNEMNRTYLDMSEKKISSALDQTRDSKSGMFPEIKGNGFVTQTEGFHNKFITDASNITTRHDFNKPVRSILSSLLY